MATNSVGASSAVSSVVYHRGETRQTQETKGGSFIYHGDAPKYHEWEFRTRLRVSQKKADAYTEAVNKVVEGLRGDAFIVAQEVGLDTLWLEDDIDHKSGIETLIQAMKASVFPLTTHEAKELFRQYCKVGGVLSRQAGESMQQ